jgi:hypothetical protein
MFTRSAVDTTAQSAKVGDMTNVSSLPEVPDARRRIARAVKAHLVVADITPTRMAAKIGMSQSAMSRRTSAIQAFDIDELASIAGALDVSIYELMQMPKDDTLDYGADDSGMAPVIPIFPTR